MAFKDVVVVVLGIVVLLPLVRKSCLALRGGVRLMQLEGSESLFLCAVKEVSLEEKMYRLSK